MKHPLFCLRPALLAIISFIGTSASAQYYYKDIIVPGQAQEKWKTLKTNNVRKITLQSLERDGQPTPGFVCTQSCAGDFRTLTTLTTSSAMPPSTLIAFYDKSGSLMKTVDSSDTYVSTTSYEYDASGRIRTVKNLALETDNKARSTEDHYWFYADAIVVSMQKIKNGTDTTFVRFKSENGQVIEEQATHGKKLSPPFYYYYDSAVQLTDIVKFNPVAGRLLPDYMFSYEDKRLVSMIVVPTGTGDYENWQYEYNEKNLKVRELCKNKKRETIAIVSYTYSFQ